MPNLKDIRNRIGSVKNTRKITSAMKMVAAAKLRRAQEAVQAARPYATKMQEVVVELVTRVSEEAHPLLKPTAREEHVLLVVVTSDRGLCGGFNSNLLRALDRFVIEKKPLVSSVKALTVGRKGNLFCAKNANIDVLEDFPGVIGAVSFEGAKRIAQRAISLYTSGEVDRVYLVYNEFISAIQTRQIITPLLPMSKPDEAEAASHAEGGEEYIYEPGEEELLAHLLPNSIEVRVFQALLESEAAEQGSRMTTMDNATSNASEMIDALTLQYNRARQAYITKELVEIVSGAESLKG